FFSFYLFFFFSSRRLHTRFSRDWSSDVCSSDLNQLEGALQIAARLNSGRHSAGRNRYGIAQPICGSPDRIKGIIHDELNGFRAMPEAPQFGGGVLNLG